MVWFTWKFEESWRPDETDVSVGFHPKSFGALGFTRGGPARAVPPAARQLRPPSLDQNPVRVARAIDPGDCP